MKKGKLLDLEIRLQDLINRYEIRLGCEKPLTGLFGKTKAKAIVYELRSVIRDLKELLEETPGVSNRPVKGGK